MVDYSKITAGNSINFQCTMDREEFPWLSRHFRALRTVSNVLVQHGGNVTLGQSSRSSYTNENYMQDSMLTMDFMTIVLASRDNL